jgi:hypothetical protein
MDAFLYVAIPVNSTEMSMTTNNTFLVSYYFLMACHNLTFMN